ncbi:MAG: hypothetical protein ACYTGZ_02560 [Planctomycetota bacterium]|jgi:hypothetical protein
MAQTHRLARLVPLAALLVALLLPACKSDKKSYSHVSRRDYYSLNKTSVAFLGEGIRESKWHRKNVWDWGDLWTENARNRKEGLAFLGSSLARHEIENMKVTWGEDFPEHIRGHTEFWRSVRFGFLDSGE